MKKYILYILPLLLFLILVGYFFWQLQFGRDPQLVPSTLIDKPVPAFVLPGLRENQPGFAAANLRKSKGPVLVNFFASWCVPCRAEHPLLMELSDMSGLTLYGIAYKDARADAIGFLDELGDPYDRTGFDANGRIAIEWGLYGVPETYIIDKQGMIRYKYTGPLTRQELDETILPLLSYLQEN